MTVYVDNPIYTRPGVKKPRKRYAHMVADSLQELAQFAAKIGVKPHFFHNSSMAHFDINQDQHAIALQNGAKLVSSKEIATIAKAVTLGAD
jgi:Protein of unknown function (DUF4031)